MFDPTALERLTDDQRREFLDALDARYQAECKRKQEPREGLWRDYGDGPGHYKLKCTQCGDSFIAGYPLAKYCCYYPCAVEAAATRRRERKETARQKVCVNCGQHFRAPRNDAKTCSNKCRQAVYRKSVTDKPLPNNFPNL